MNELNRLDEEIYTANQLLKHKKRKKIMQRRLLMTARKHLKLGI